MIALVTGVAGFIGMHVALKLLEMGHKVVGIDNMNNYYSVQLKNDRLQLLLKHQNFSFKQVDISDLEGVRDIFASHNFSCVIHLAAQAGVRYSLIAPHEYSKSNLVGFLNIMDCARLHDVEKFLYASSSSVYGGNVKQPFSETDMVDSPVSLYAATKKANELMAHSYSHLYSLQTIGFRFFTVYGPWGRPDMAYFKFAQAIINREPIDVYNNGDMLRDFTYVDDIVEGVVNSCLKRNEDFERYSIFNIGNNFPVKLEVFIEAIESALSMKAIKNYLPMQPGDVPATYADISRLEKSIDFRPSTTIELGVSKFVSWFKQYYGY